MTTIDRESIVQSLVARFKSQEKQISLSSSKYTESELRAEFIDPLFECLGWDMTNKNGVPNTIKDVVREESQTKESISKRPDYTFRILGIRKFFLEAKKPSVDIRRSKESAYQVRRYGWTAGLPISLLSNFKTIRVYDTQNIPSESESVDAGLLIEFDYSEFVKEYHTLSGLFSRAAVGMGSVEKKFGVRKAAAIPVNKVFLDRINEWRLHIAADLHKRYQNFSLDDLNDIAQKIINRLIFMRMCEDRGIENEERLRKVAEKKDYIEVRNLVQELDNRYDTGLFDVAGDPLQKTHYLNSDVLLDIVSELYFPKAPYSFSVLDADFLGQVYESFLTQRLALDARGKVILKQKPAYEDREVITTPQPLVDEIVRKSFNGLREDNKETGLSYEKLKSLKIIDIAVGSGRFLIRAFDELVAIAITILKTNGSNVSVYQVTTGDYRLAFEKKYELLQNCLYGIDIDYNAVEVARFSLLVKLLEDESKATLPKGNRILPNIDSNIAYGNSIVDTDFPSRDPDVIRKTRPYGWQHFPFLFDMVLSNPPYIKTEEMKVKTPDEFAYFKKEYTTSFKQFDKYFIFLERAISKLSKDGRVGMIVSNKWITIESAKKLREIFAKNDLVSEIVNYGNELVFEGKSAYACQLLLSKISSTTFQYQYIRDYEKWLSEPNDKGFKLDKKILQEFDGSPWILPNDTNEAQVLSLLFQDSHPLREIADVFNGIQTSAEDIFAITSWTEKEDTIQFRKFGKEWRIEKGITKPYLIDSKKRVWSFLPIVNDALVIFPYTYNSKNETVLISPDDLSRQFPLTWNYLKAHENRLIWSNEKDHIKRDVSPPPAVGEFYRYGRHQSLYHSFVHPKIVLSVNQLGDKYGIDFSGVGFASGGTAGEIAISNPKYGYSLEFILGLLHQRAIEFYLRKRGSSFRGGYYSRGTAVISDTPVPNFDFTNKEFKQIHDEITNLVRKIISDTNKLSMAVGRDQEILKRQIDENKGRTKKLFDTLFKLNGEDLKVKLPGE